MWAVRTSSCAVFFCEKKKVRSLWDNTQTTRWGDFSLTELTDLTEHICALFRTHRRPPAYRVHGALLLKVAVRFCEIGWLNVSVGLCVFCSSVFFLWEKECTLLMRLGLWDLLGSFFSHRAHRVHWAFWRTFRAHRTPPAYRVHRGLSTNISCNALWYRLT